MKTKVVGVRLDLDDVRKLEEMAKARGLKIGELLRIIIVQYIDSQSTPEEGADDETIKKLNEIVELVKKKMEEIYKKWINHIDTVVKEIVERHPNEDPTRWRNEYYKRYKFNIYSDLKIIVERYSNEIKTMPISDQLKDQYYKKLWDILNSYHLYP